MQILLHHVPETPSVRGSSAFEQVRHVSFGLVEGYPWLFSEWLCRSRAVYHMFLLVCYMVINHKFYMLVAS